MQLKTKQIGSCYVWSQPLRNHCCLKSPPCCSLSTLPPTPSAFFCDSKTTCTICWTRVESVAFSVFCGICILWTLTRFSNIWCRGHRWVQAVMSGNGYGDKLSSPRSSLDWTRRPAACPVLWSDSAAWLLKCCQNDHCNRKRCELM